MGADPLRLLTWNIRAGGGTRLPRLAEAIAAFEADVLVLTEYRSGEAGRRLRAVLYDLGFAWLSPVEPPGIRNGVLIATRTRPRSVTHVTEHVPEPWRMLAVTIDRVRLFGIYMPNLKAKVPYWEALIEASGPHAGGHALALGDFNTCRAYVDEPGATDATALFLDKIQAAGFAMSGEIDSQMDGSIPGTVIAAMDSASIMLSPHRVLPGTSP
jgi:exonuclease III